MPPAEPKSPNPDFDFMLKDQAKARRGLPMPNLPKPAKIALAVVGVLILLIIISSLLSGRNSGSSQAFADVLARGQETIRVTQVAQQLNFQNPQTTALAATVSAAISSDSAQVTTYLAKNHIKLSSAQLAADKDSSTDASLQTASQNNNLDGAYVTYLQGALTKYEADLQTAYKSAGPNGKKLLQTVFDSASTLLSTPPLKS